LERKLPLDVAHNAPLPAAAAPDSPFFKPLAESLLLSRLGFGARALRSVSSGGRGAGKLRTLAVLPGGLDAAPGSEKA
jgi:hypothetical protein